MWASDREVSLSPCRAPQLRAASEQIQAARAATGLPPLAIAERGGQAGEPSMRPPDTPRARMPDNDPWPKDKVLRGMARIARQLPAGRKLTRSHHPKGCRLTRARAAAPHC